MTLQNSWAVPPIANLTYAPFVSTTSVIIGFIAIATLLHLLIVMTVLSIEATAEDTLPSSPTNDDNEDLCLSVPNWVQDQRDDWGSPLSVHEWDDVDSYRQKNGWQGRDLVHDAKAPVRVLEYFVNYGQGIPGTPLKKGGVGTVLTGISHFTKRAESHKGYCHGGSMCSLMDDIIGWCAFLTTGECIPWSGFTVQVNTALKKPIPVDTYLLVKATITKVERRKISISAELIDPSCEDQTNNLHATGEGLVILNKGVLPPEAEQKKDA